tara:strand:+ start:547 stop:1164 length:618 start_codon:yes stop_codon:yes gene_type:complete
MRLIIVGCEYSGVTTLINAIHGWGLQHGMNYHLDDHFTIPDAFHLSQEEQQAMLDMLPAIKERFQRFQIAYHVKLLHRFSHILLGGFHIEEIVYGPRYYYPGINIEVREWEPEMPSDTILVHLHASVETIQRRMVEKPHPHQLVPSSDVSVVSDEFKQQFNKSWIKKKFSIDTTDLTSDGLLESFFNESIPHINESDALTRLLIQ